MPRWPGEAPPFSLSGKITLVVLLLLLATAGVSAGLSWLGLGPWLVFLFAAAVMMPAGAWLLGRVFGPATRTLQGLVDGVRSFRDRDFSMRLAARRRDELGQLAALFNDMGDVLRSERKDLLQKEMMLDSVFQSTPSAIVLTNPRGRVVYSNRAARALLGGGRRLEGRELEEILGTCPAEMRDALGADSDVLFTAGEEDDEETFHLSQRVFHVNAQRHTLIMVRRLTHELRRQEVAVWKKVIRVMSHELNNTLAPITSLFHSARTVVHRPEHADKLDTIFASIEERTAHLKEFLEGYARFARLPRPRAEEVEWEPFLAGLRQLVGFQVQGDLPDVPGHFDPAQMQQALINLIKNAGEAGSSPEEIVVAAVAAEGGGARIQVLDRGRGMDDDTLSRALLPFYSSKKTGTGLGLPLCREILEAHGGRIRIENRDGGGTAVTCWLPAAPGGTAGPGS